MDWRTKNITRGGQAGEILRKLQPAILWVPESSARTMCAAGPVKELIANTVLNMMRTAQATIAGSARVCSVFFTMLNDNESFEVPCKLCLGKQIRKQKKELIFS